MASEHPALKDFSPTWEGFKHIAGKALKWAAWGAVALGLLALIPAASVGALGAVVEAAASFFGINAASSVGTSILMTGLLKGATIGAVLGGITGVGGVGKAIEESRQDHIANHEQMVVFEERNRLLKRQRNVEYAQSGGVSPNIAFGQGQDRGAVRGG